MFPLLSFILFVCISLCYLLYISLYQHQPISLNILPYTSPLTKNVSTLHSWFKVECRAIYLKYISLWLAFKVQLINHFTLNTSSCQFIITSPLHSIYYISPIMIREEPLYGFHSLYYHHVYISTVISSSVILVFPLFSSSSFTIISNSSLFTGCEL